jgi:hypothetical protein
MEIGLGCKCPKSYFTTVFSAVFGKLLALILYLMQAGYRIRGLIILIKTNK